MKFVFGCTCSTRAEEFVLVSVFSGWIGKKAVERSWNVLGTFAFTISTSMSCLPSGGRCCLSLMCFFLFLRSTFFPWWGSVDGWEGAPSLCLVLVFFLCLRISVSGPHPFWTPGYRFLRFAVGAVAGATHVVGSLTLLAYLVCLGWFCCLPGNKKRCDHTEGRSLFIDSTGDFSVTARIDRVLCCIRTDKGGHWAERSRSVWV